MNIDLKYKSEAHDRILAALRARKDLSMRRFQQLQDWERDDEIYRCYIPEKETDAARRAEREVAGEPQYRTLVIPYSYALMLTAHTYETSVFLGRDPIFQYTGRHGESEESVEAVEALIDYQMRTGGATGGNLVPFYGWLLDKYRYGMGFLLHNWDEEVTRVSRVKEVTDSLLGFPIKGRTKKVREFADVMTYQGNRARNVRPDEVYPDPRKSLAYLHEGEFFGWKFQMGWHEVLGKPEDYINLDAVQKRGWASEGEEGDNAGADIELPQLEYAGLSRWKMTDVKGIEGYEMAVRLSPKAWRLGDESKPEMWVFTVAFNEIIIKARPVGEYHGKFPVDVLQYEMDPYPLNPISASRQLDPLNEVLTWLFNSHMYNVRDALNNNLIYDPSRLSPKDMERKGPGSRIRALPAAYGQDLRTMVHQLQSRDVTQSHMNDAQVVMALMQRVSGINDNIMGMVNVGGRKTATEVRTSSSFSVNRLKTQSEFDSAMGISSLSGTWLQRTQQFYDEEQIFKIAGETGEAMRYIKVSPDTIAGLYDFVPVDGTMPVDRFAMANLWRELMREMRTFPQLLQQYDVGRIFAYTAKLAGAKNVDKFRVQVVPDAAAANAAQAGNVVPIGAMGGGTPESKGAGRDPERVAEPGQVSGLGPTG